MIAVALPVSSQAGDYLDVVEPGPRTLWAAGLSHPAFAAPGSSASTEFLVGGSVTPVAACEAGLHV